MTGTGTCEASSKWAVTQPLLPRPYSVGSVKGRVRAASLESGSLAERFSFSPSTVMKRKVLSLTFIARWPQGKSSWAPG